MKQSVAEFLHLMYRGINLVLSTKQGGVIYHWTRLFFNINIIKATLEKKKKKSGFPPPGGRRRQAHFLYDIVPQRLCLEDFATTVPLALHHGSTTVKYRRLKTAQIFHFWPRSGT